MYGLFQCRVYWSNSIKKNINNDIGYKYTHTFFFQNLLVVRYWLNQWSILKKKQFHCEKIHPKLILKLMELFHFVAHTERFSLWFFPINTHSLSDQSQEASCTHHKFSSDIFNSTSSVGACVLTNNSSDFLEHTPLLSYKMTVFKPVGTRNKALLYRRPTEGHFEFSINTGNCQKIFTFFLCLLAVGERF